MQISARRVSSDLKPHYWKERAGMYKVRFGAWVFVGHDLMNCHQNYLYWSMHSNVKPSS